MNTPLIEVKKVEAWLGSNWYPFGIGYAAGVVSFVVLHLLKWV